MTTTRYREPKRRGRRRPNLANGLACLVLGIAASTLCAGLGLLWATSPLGSIPILTPAAQGSLLGAIVALLARWAGVRAAGARFALGLACGVASLAALHGGHYAKFVLLDVPRLIRAEGLPPRQAASLLRLQAENPWVFADQLVLGRKTGWVGFPGFMALRSHVGESIGGRVLRDWPLWGLWGVEAAVIVLVPAFLAAARARPDGARPGEAPEAEDPRT
jgi:hypothetical protein